MRLRARRAAVLGATAALLLGAAPSWAQQSARTPPRLLRAEQAAYPEGVPAREDAVIVRLELELDETGRVTSARVVGSSGERAFDDAAVAAARGFAFEPAREGGRAVPARLRYRYRFAPPATRATQGATASPPASATPAASTTPATTTAPATPTARATTTAPAATQTAPAAAPEEQGLTVRSRVRSREMNRREMTAEELARMPGSRGDPLLALQNLPGLARPPFGLGQFIVRSSAPEDSLVTLEGQPILLPFHFGGFASTVATEMIDRIEFLPGNFSARYGRVAGGVININLNTPPRDRIHADVDLDLIDVGAYASAPLGRNASIAIGGRRSFIDLVGPPTYSLFTGTSPSSQFRQWPAYYDGQVVFDWDVTPRDSIRVIASATDDQLILNFSDPSANDPNLRGTLGTHLSFAGLQTRWRHRFSPDVVHTFSPAIAYNLTSGNVGTDVNFNFQSVVFNLRDELEVHLSRSARLFVGIDSQYGYLDNVVHAPPLSMNGITDPTGATGQVSYAGRGTFLNPGAYVETELDASRAVRVLAGARVDYFGQLNATTFNPRAMVRVALHPRITARAGFGVYSTPPRGYYIVPGFGNPHLQPETWTHSTAGVAMEILPGLLELDTDVFVKLGSGTVAPSARVLGDGTPERFANTGEGRVIGGEWFLRLRATRRSPVYGQVSYTYQRAVRSQCQGCPMTTYTYDQPHILSVVLGAVLPWGLEAGARMRYTSGAVEPVVTGAVYDADHDVALTLTNPAVTGRLPDFFSVDVRVAKRFRLGPFRMQGVLEVLNVFDNQNPESRVYSYDRRTSALIYGLPILPSLGIRGEY